VKYAATIIALIWCASAEFANAAPLLELHIGRDGYVHFGSGPQLNGDQLRDQIHILMKQDPRPNIVVMPDRLAKYESVEKVMGLFQREGYGPHFGIVGVAQ
jgi:biopolymer transport protein ExbD